MIKYNEKSVVGLLYQRRGSVLPKTMFVCIPAGFFAALLNVMYQYFFPEATYFKNIHYITTSYTSVIGFLLVFRCRVAWSRFWEGASYLQKIKSGWMNATSNVFAFCSVTEDTKEDVRKFQHMFARIMSMMYAAALNNVSGGDHNRCKVFDPEGLDPQLLAWVTGQHDRLEILMAWIQRHIVESHRLGIISTPPPLLTRVFQELSNGMIDISNAKRINQFPFPFPYAQMISLMLLMQVLTSVVVGGVTMSHPAASFLYSTVATLSVWSINFIAIEIEAPFGIDENDLPVAKLMQSFNDGLAVLLLPQTQTPPHMVKFDSSHLLLKTIHWNLDEDIEIRYAEGDSDHYNVGHVQAALVEKTRKSTNPTQANQNGLHTQIQVKAQEPADPVIEASVRFQSPENSVEPRAAPPGKLSEPKVPRLEVPAHSTPQPALVQEAAEAAQTMLEKVSPHLLPSDISIDLQKSQLDRYSELAIIELRKITQTNRDICDLLRKSSSKWSAREGCNVQELGCREQGILCAPLMASNTGYAPHR